MHREGMKIGFDDGRGYEGLREYPMVVLCLHGVVWKDDVWYLCSCLGKSRYPWS